MEVERRVRIATWVARQVMPHEADVCAWLLRWRAAPDDADELIQEAYCRLAMLDSVDHIGRPDAYFFSIVRNLYVRRLKRARVVPFETIAAIESYSADEAPSPEREAGGRLEVERVLALIARLLERCRQIVQMRRIEGLSQKGDQYRRWQICNRQRTAVRHRRGKGSDPPVRRGARVAASRPAGQGRSMVPVAGIEPATFGLQNRCSTS